MHGEWWRRTGTRRSAAAAAGFWALGIVLAFHPTLLTGFARVQGAPVDTRLMNYTLEQEYRWLLSLGGDDLWNPAFHFPAPNVAAYSDVMLLVMPLYAGWRALGFPYDTAFQLWTMTVLSLNFLAFWLFLRRVVRASPIAAGFGAFLFAFGAPRVNQIGHEQLFSQFYLVAILYALCRLFAADDGSGGRRNEPIWIAVALGGAVAQLYSGFYFAWFFFFALLVTAVWAMALPSWRRRVLSTLRRQWRPLAVGIVLAAVALAPLALHYLAAMDTVGVRAWSVAERMLPRPQSWLYLGPFSRLYRWQYDLAMFRTLFSDQEHRLGVGVVTTGLVGFGLYWRRRQASTRLLLLVAATVALCVTVPIGDWTWRLVFAVVPGANALRAVARIGMLMLIPAGIGAAYFVDAMASHRGLLVLAMVASVLEQAQTTPSFEKLHIRSDVQALAERIDPNCDAFLFTPIGAAGRSGYEDGKHHADAMWAQLLTGVPTINGLTSNEPPGWDFGTITFADETAAASVAQSLHAWRRRWDLEAARICWLRAPVDWSWASQEPLREAVLQAWRELWSR